MKKVISLKMLIAFFLVVFCIQNSASAQKNKVEVLETKIEKLQQIVLQLESKVVRLEKLLSNQNVTVPPKRSHDSGGWENRQNWRILEMGMSKAEVKQILGEPDHIVGRLSGDDWRYPDGGIVNFDQDEEVEGWFEPTN